MPFNLSNRVQALEAVRTILRYIGEDPDRPGLKDTPDRYLRAWEECWGAGYKGLPKNCLRTFPHEGATYNQMIFQGNITFHSHCEHHLAPFFGVAHIAYIAEEGGPGLLGLSKLARIVNHCARRLQVQERLTEQIADVLSGLLMGEVMLPDGNIGKLKPSVGVQLRATHLCMVSRGVQQPNSTTITTTLRGKLLGNPAAQAEFLRYADAASHG